MNHGLNDNFLKDDNGNVRGKLYAAFINTKESNGFKIQADELSADLLAKMPIGTELTCASTSNNSKVINIDGLNIELDKPMFTANATILKSGEIIIIKDDDYYNPDTKSLVVQTLTCTFTQLISPI